ncbi:MAG TPA: SRPBCC family protein, partial [Kofleriaceae bacterium]|nr:SRPBCC family protein [Kofleriaceae bacterium]
MPSASKLIPRSPQACWRQFVDADRLVGWVPGLRRARVVATHDDGLAREVAFEFATSRTYSLVYTYDAAARQVSWAPRIGQRDAVRGSARFDPEDGGTRVTYTLEPAVGRTAAEVAQDDPQALLDAFARWMSRVPA